MVNTLSPAQQAAADTVTQGLTRGSVVTLRGGEGMGKTTVLQALHAQLGGVLLNMKDFMDTLRDHHPLALEESFVQMVLTALRQHRTVLLDDLDLLSNVVSGCYGSYPRAGFLDAPAKIIATYAEEADRKLIVASGNSIPDPIRNRAVRVHIPQFEAEDYGVLCRGMLQPEAGDRLDYEKVHRFAGHLGGYELRYACGRLSLEPGLDTERFIAFLQSQGLTSNIDLEEVQQVDLRDIKGCSEVIRSLEAHIVVPLERDDLAVELGLKPKRGVLLAGPPGTGKTTVGRALAHRLRGKFFLIDGTVIAGSGSFYAQIAAIFEAAKENAPSVIFIDDSDVIFESGAEFGLYRYLLTMLDGLESESSGSVCVVLTAMDVANIPPALLRSGRVELWLEMRLPDAGARREILKARLANVPPPLGEPELDSLVSATEGFTGADLKRLVEDGKNLAAYDRANELPARASTAYYLQAVETMLENRARYEQAEARRRARRGSGTPAHRSGFGPFPGLSSSPD